MYPPLEHEEEEGEGLADTQDTIVQTLALQLAGVLHKLIQASLFMIAGNIRGAQMSSCLHRQLVISYDITIQNITHIYSKTTLSRLQHDRSLILTPNADIIALFLSPFFYNLVFINLFFTTCFYQFVCAASVVWLSLVISGHN